MMSAKFPRQGCCCPRAAFTLVELMVVVAIIGVIIALTTAAAMQVVSYQRSSNTDGTIQTVNGALQRQWAAIIAFADKDAIPNAVISMAGGDQKRARVIWKKLRLKEAFPMNFREAMAPWSLGNNPPSAIELQMQQVLPGRQAYKSAIAQATALSLLSPSPNPADWPKESAYCLVLALGEGFGGNTFSAESLGTNALASEAIGMKRFVDGWSNPLVLYRWPTADRPSPADELDSSSPLGPYDPNNQKTWRRDPLDPEGLLDAPDWNNAANLSAKQGVWWFEQYCHTVHDTTLGARRFQRSRYLVPVIASAGRDGILGLRSTANSPLLPDRMAIDVLTPGASAGSVDNIYSFRLRLGGRGEQ